MMMNNNVRETISFQSTVRGNTIVIPDRYMRSIPARVVVTIQPDEEGLALSSGGDSQLLYELRKEAEGRGFLTNAEIEDEIEKARAEKRQSTVPA